jgi:hypothetical protein
MLWLAIEMPRYPHTVFPGTWFVRDHGSSKVRAETWGGYMEYAYDVVLPAGGEPLDVSGMTPRRGETKHVSEGPAPGRSALRGRPEYENSAEKVPSSLLFAGW